MSVGHRLLCGVAVAFLGVIAVMGLVPGWLNTADPVLPEITARLLPPSAEHWFGTDQSGRDVFARVVHGAGRSVGIGLLATACALAAGLLIGALAGVLPRPIAHLMMRMNDILLAFPEVLIALIVVGVLGPGVGNVILAVTIAAIPVYVRLAYAQTRSVREAEHVEAARILGVPGPLAFLRHVIPAVLGSLSVLATIGVGTSILAVAGLSFLGLGTAEPLPEWGLMLAGGRNVLDRAWWITLFPGLAITLTVIALSLLGRTLRRRLEGRAS